MKNKLPQHFDIAIMGAGVVGLCAAILLHKAGFKIAIINPPLPLPKKVGVRGQNKIENHSSVASRHLLLQGEKEENENDNRAIAIMEGQWCVLEACEIADKLLPFAAPLEHLVLIDDTRRILPSPTTQFSAEELDYPTHKMRWHERMRSAKHEEEFEREFSNSSKLNQYARNVPITKLFEQLHASVKKLKIHNIKKKPQVIVKNDFNSKITFEDGAHITTNLVVASDGKHSIARILADISQSVEKLPQTALSFTVHHELPHNNTSYEFHTRTGPITFVPILNPHQCNCIWTVDVDLKQELLALSDVDFNAKFNEVSHQILGDNERICPINSWPLQIARASVFGKNRTALVGDAAHSFPPIGAQGLNLGLRDVRTLVDILVEAQNLGQDIGSGTVLNIYSNARQSDIFSVVSAVKMLNFSLVSNNPLTHISRSMGLLALKTLPFLRNKVVEKGLMGV